ncbi:MAG: transposase [Treponema sp.]|jgi:transposase|nr:transposase [Treponema sp.]
MGRELLNLYSDYLLYSNGQTTATGLSKLLGEEISHDTITRFLSSENFDEKALWKKIKKVVRAYEHEEACLIFDDTIIEKPYMDENEIVCWYYDHKEKRPIKGINLLTAFYVTGKERENLRVPIGYRVIAKSEEYKDEKSGETKRKSPLTKNEMMQEMIQRHMRNEVRFKYILADSWYSSAENMRYINKRKKVFIVELKENRKVTTSEEEREKGQFERLNQIKVPEEKPVKVWIKDLQFPVMLFKQVFRNKDGTEGIRFLVTNDETLTDDQYKTLYKKRWGVEENHKSLKQNASIGNSPAHNERTQSNHIYAAIYGYSKLEILKLATGFNHFAIKTKIYMTAIQAAMMAFRELWKHTEKLAFA